MSEVGDSMRRMMMLPVIVLASAMLLCGCQSKNKERQEYRQSAIEQIEAGDYSGAVAAFDKALAVKKGIIGEFELDVLKYRAEAEYKAGDFTAAAHTYDILIEADGEQAAYLDMRCIANMAAGNLNQALADYEKARTLEDGAVSNPQVLLALAQALEDSGEHDRAMEFYRQAMDAGLVDAGLYNKMGLCSLEEGNYQEALSYFDQGIKTGEEGERARLIYNQAVTYEKMEEFSKALELFETYNQAYGPDPEVEREIAFLKTR